MKRIWGMCESLNLETSCLQSPWGLRLLAPVVDSGHSNVWKRRSLPKSTSPWPLGGEENSSGPAATVKQYLHNVSTRGIKVCMEKLGSMD